MKNALKIILLLLLVQAPWLQTDASTLAYPQTAGAADNISTTLPGSSVKLKKTGLFKRLQAVRAIKKMVKAQGRASEGPSNLAQVALVLFISALILAAIALLEPFVFYLVTLLFIISIILAIMVSTKDNNIKSKRIAFFILATSATLALVGLIFAIILFIELISFFF